MDSIDIFYKSYLQNVKEISKKQLANKRIYDENLYDAANCWMVTDNIEALIANGGVKQEHIFVPKNTTYFKKVLYDAITQKKLITVFQDAGTPQKHKGRDHWFSIVGLGDDVVVFEHLPDICNSAKIYPKVEYIDFLSDILNGVVPDIFYGKKEKHFFELYIFDRLPLKKKRIREFLDNETVE